MQALLSHIDVLQRVKLFQDCSEFVLRVIAMSLRQRIYCPGDYLVLKGEIGLLAEIVVLCSTLSGDEMFIVECGFVEIVDFDGDDEIVYAKLGRGSIAAADALCPHFVQGSTLERQRS
jgi:hypothetical protein